MFNGKELADLYMRHNEGTPLANDELRKLANFCNEMAYFCARSGNDLLIQKFVDVAGTCERYLEARKES